MRKTRKYFQNVECGNIFPFTKAGYRQVVEEAEILYDYGDPTNPIDLDDYYIVIEM